VARVDETRVFGIGLLCCPECGWYTRCLELGGICRNCAHDWVFCAEHSCLERKHTVHKKVTVRQVLNELEVR
jgi:hypothetical protein